MDVTDVMNGCDDKAQRLGMEALTEIERTVVLVNRASFEITCGGLHAFYYNSSGDYSAETMFALHRIGSIDSAMCLLRANELFPASVPAKDRLERYDQLEIVKKLPGGPLDEIADDISRCEEEIWSQLCRFIELNADHLREHSGKMK